MQIVKRGAKGKCLKKNQNAPRPSEHPPVRLLLIHTFSVLSLQLKKLR